jgi:hypothetical protein
MAMAITYVFMSFFMVVFPFGPSFVALALYDISAKVRAQRRFVEMAQVVKEQTSSIVGEAPQKPSFDERFPDINVGIIHALTFGGE